MEPEERKKQIQERRIAKKLAREQYSLRMSCLYKLSVANHFRDNVFWLPINLDFRGRVYPIPPHCSHVGGFWFVKTVRPSVRAATIAFQSSSVSVPVRPTPVVVPTSEPRLHLLFCLLPVLFFSHSCSSALKSSKEAAAIEFWFFSFLLRDICSSPPFSRENSEKSGRSYSGVEPTTFRLLVRPYYF